MRILGCRILGFSAAKFLSACLAALLAGCLLAWLGRDLWHLPLWANVGVCLVAGLAIGTLLIWVGRREKRRGET